MAHPKNPTAKAITADESSRKRKAGAIGTPKQDMRHDTENADELRKKIMAIGEDAEKRLRGSMKILAR